MRKFICGISLLVLVHLLPAQQLSTHSKKAQKLFVEAERLYRNDKSNDAILLLEQALKKDKEFKEAYLLLADIYYSRKWFDKEKVALEKAIEIDSTYFLTAYYNVGVACFHLNQYEEVVSWMNKYDQKTAHKKNRLDTDIWIEKALFAHKATQQPIPFEPVNLGPAINSDYDEYWPSITADESELVYTVLIPKDTALFKAKELPKSSLFYREDFYASTKMQGKWTPRNAVHTINTNDNEGAQSLSADGNWMFFTACGRQGGHGSCDLYFSYKSDRGWSKPVNLGPPVNTPYWESQPCIAADGRTLYFASNRHGGEGKKDIWKASVIGFKTDMTPVFSNIENLGKRINTKGDENSPFMHHDNQTLYFSSDGWPGMGQMDLFMSTRNEADQWSEAPMNLGHPINTANDEIGLVINASGTRAYFSSDGLPSETRGKDLYSFNLPEKFQPNPVSYVKGRVLNKNTKERLEASFKLKNVNTKEVIVSAHSNKVTGSFLVCLPAGGEYALSVEKPGYLFYSESFNLDAKQGVDEPLLLDVFLSPIQAGERIVLKNIFFATDAYELLPESHVELNTLIELLELNTNLRVEIGGHTDHTGSAEYNQQLSENRARSVYQFLVENGINSKRLQYKGYGFEVPLESNETESGRAKNRRTEIKVLP